MLLRTNMPSQKIQLSSICSVYVFHLIKGEDRLYEADIALYQLKIVLGYLNNYQSSEGEARELVRKKLKRHIQQVDPLLKDADLSQDLETLRARLQSQLIVAESFKNAEEESYN